MTPDGCRRWLQVRQVMRKVPAGQPESDGIAGPSARGLTQLHRLQLLGRLGGPAELVLDALSQAIGGGGRAMNNEDHPRGRPEAPEPAEDLSRTRIGRKHGGRSAPA